MSDDKDSKTEEPTSKRRSQAREEGNVPNSQEVTNAAILLGAVIFAIAILPWAADRISSHLATFLSRAHVFRVTGDSLKIGLMELAWTLLPYMAVVAALFMVVGLTSQVGQFGLLFTTKPLKPKLSTLSPIKGFKKMASVKSLLEFLKGLPKMFVVGIAAYFVLRPFVRNPYHYIDQDMSATLKDFHEALVALLVAIFLVMVVIAFFDLVYTRYKHTKDLRMTKQEVKDEHKNMEGDPKVKQRIANLRAERTRERMMQAVPKADVVVTNPTHYAVALKYDMDTMAAPRLVAKGQDHLALRIRKVAEEHEVPIVENPPLARVLHASVDLDQEIPPEHYQAVAEVIGYVMRLKKRRPA